MTAVFTNSHFSSFSKMLFYLSYCSLIKAVWFLVAAFSHLRVRVFFLVHICLKITPQGKLAHGQVG